MARIVLEKFMGEMPRISAWLLPDGFAQQALNTKLLKGDLRPYAASKTVGKPTKAGTKKKIHRWGTVIGGDAEGTITAVANTTPVGITSVGHGRTTGERLFITGTGLGIDDVTYTITVTGTDTYTLDGTSASGTAAIGSWVKENGYWFHWLTDVDAVPGPIAGDTSERTYLTDGTQPTMTYSPIATSGGGTDYPNNTYNLGIPAPTTALTATPGAGGGCSAADQTSTVYVYTYVSALGEEGPPSPPSSVVSFCPGQTIDLSAMATGPAGSYNITQKYIYRTKAGSDIYDYVGSVAVATTTFADTYADTDLGDPIETEGWIAPPATFRLIGALPNGIMVGFDGSDVYFSPAFKPHAYPVKWSLTSDWPIVGGGIYGNSVVIVTKGQPYLVTGSDPAAMSMDKLNVQQAGVSKTGIAAVDGFGVVYPSPDGLVAVGPGAEPVVITDKFMTRDDWQALKPESMIGFGYNGRYICFYDDGVTPAGFIFDPRDMGAALVHIDDTATGGFVDPVTDSLYLIVGNYIKRFDGASTNQSYTWKSKIVRTNSPINFAMGRVFADSYASLTFKLYADGVLKNTTTVTSKDPFRLPDGYTAEDWEILLTGTDTVTKVVIGEDVEDFQGV